MKNSGTTLKDIQDTVGALQSCTARISGPLDRSQSLTLVIGVAETSLNPWQKRQWNQGACTQSSTLCVSPQKGLAVQAGELPIRCLNCQVTLVHNLWLLQGGLGTFVMFVWHEFSRVAVRSIWKGLSPLLQELVQAWKGRVGHRMLQRKKEVQA